MIDETVIRATAESELASLDDRELQALERDPSVSRALLVAVVAEMMRRRRERAITARERRESGDDAQAERSAPVSTPMSTPMSTSLSTSLSTSAAVAARMVATLTTARGAASGDPDELRQAMTRLGERLTRLERRATTLGWWMLALSGAWAIWMAATGARGQILP